MLMTGAPAYLCGMGRWSQYSISVLTLYQTLFGRLHAAFADDAFIVLCLMRGGINVTVVRRPVPAFAVLQALGVLCVG